MTEKKTDLELRRRAICISLLPPCFSMLPLCTLNLCLNLRKKKACTQRDANFLPLKLPFSATQAKIFHPYYNVVASNSWILRNFHSKLCPLRTSTHSPAVGQWIVPCVIVKPVTPAFFPLNLTRFHLPTHACQMRVEIVTQETVKPTTVAVAVPFSST